MKNLHFIIISSMLISCAPKARLVQFELPDNFRGLLCVVQTHKPQGVRLASGAYVLQVGMDGLAAIDDMEVLGRSHRLEGVYRNGKIIYYYGVGRETTDLELGLYSLGNVHGKGDYYFVGSRSEYEYIVSSLDFTQLPLAMPIPVKK